MYKKTEMETYLIALDNLASLERSVGNSTVWNVLFPFLRTLKPTPLLKFMQRKSPRIFYNVQSIIFYYHYNSRNFEKPLN